MAHKCPIPKVQDLENGKVDFTELKVDGSEFGATGAEVTLAAGAGSFHKKYTVTNPAAIPATVRFVELSHISTAIEKTIADLAVYAGHLVIVKNTSASGNENHKVTLLAGTWDGTNDIATLNDGGECLVVVVDKAGNGSIVENINAVALSESA